jgi:putative ATPase
MHRPLAEGLRPKDWSEIVGLDAIERTFLERIKRGLGILPSIILWGPPGCGKTSFARLIKTSYQDHLFVELSAVLSGVKEVKEVCERAKEKPTILFIYRRDS